MLYLKFIEEKFTLEDYSKDTKILVSFSYSFSKDSLKYLKDIDEIYIYVGNKKSYNNLKEQIYKYSNIKEIEYIENLHIKSYYTIRNPYYSPYFEKEFVNIDNYFGSMNMISAQKIETRAEFILKKSTITDYDPSLAHSATNFTCSSLNKIEKMTGISLKDIFSEYLPYNKIKNKTPMLDASEYYSTICKKLEEYLNKYEYVHVVIASPHININFLIDAFPGLQNLKDINSLWLCTDDTHCYKILKQYNLYSFLKKTYLFTHNDLHLKYILIYGKDSKEDQNPKKVFCGVGSSNFTFAGMGLKKEYTKLELNYYVEDNMDNILKTYNFIKKPIDTILKDYKFLSNYIIKRYRTLDSIKKPKIYKEVVNYSIKKFGYNVLDIYHKDMYNFIKKVKEGLYKNDSDSLYKDYIILFKKIYNKNKEEDMIEKTLSMLDFFKFIKILKEYSTPIKVSIPKN